MIREIVLPHILAGLLALTAGTVALVAAKGGRLHRRSGIVFVYAMLAMAIGGAILAAAKFHVVYERMNIVVAALTAYLVISALMTVRPRSAAVASAERALAVVALALGLFAIGTGAYFYAQPKVPWIVVIPSLIFGTVALLAFVGDVRMVRAGGLRGARRIARHLWRMCFAMFIATGSFFLGQAKVFPESIRIVPLLALPVILVLLAMAYWWVRVRFAKRRFAFVPPSESPAHAD